MGRCERLLLDLVKPCDLQASAQTVLPSSYDELAMLVSADSMQS